MMPVFLHLGDSSTEHVSLSPLATSTLSIQVPDPRKPGLGNIKIQHHYIVWSGVRTEGVPEQVTLTSHDGSDLPDPLLFCYHEMAARVCWLAGMRSTMMEDIRVQEFGELNELNELEEDGSSSDLLRTALSCLG